ncbi:MAG: hypothetical protein D6820_04595 [Lentisphaerae bacterium]|nr:MAG: hypothetical protein D6820_04595 [Lentisphaerota bacterium]
MAPRKEKAKKKRMIRLDDLLPKEDVNGGRKVVFGASLIFSENEENEKNGYRHKDREKGKL